MRHPLAALALTLGLWAAAPAARAGLYYSGETYAELPSNWRGFLLDQRQLRTVAVKPAGAAPVGPARARYEQEATKLAKLAQSRKLTADEAADLGALYVRLGDGARALEVLRPAQREHPEHFHLAANLGTAWQLHGDFAQAAAALQQAVRLAPGKDQKAEELHLKLVRLRGRERRDAQGLDDLFGVRYVGTAGKYEPGHLAPAQRKRLPTAAVAQAQQLALWLPADARLLWQLAELAAAHGDVATAAAIMDGCVTEFGLRDATLREHRRAMRSAADERAKNGPTKEHDASAATWKPRSSRPLVRRIDAGELPPVRARGVNALPWTVVTETTVDRQYHPTFPRYLKQLDGKEVSLTGFMQPLGEELEVNAFMLIEYPVGCWYCEMPEMTAIVLVELPANKTYNYTRGQVRITGRLKLNDSDPENFLFILRQAKVTEAE